MSDIKAELDALNEKHERMMKTAETMLAMLRVGFVTACLGYVIESGLLMVFGIVVAAIPCVWIEVNS